MFRLADIRIRPKLIVLFILTGIIPLIIAGLYGSRLAVSAMMEKSFSQLLTVQTLRKGQLENTFSQHFKDLKILAQGPHIRNTTEKLIGHYIHNFKESDADFHSETKSYQMIVDEYANFLSGFASSYGYENLMIMCAAHGHVMYHAGDDNSAGFSLKQSEYQDTGLMKAWQDVVKTKEQTFIDFQPYAPSGGVESAFFGEPLFNLKDELIAVVVVQATPSFISRIMESRKGMGETGESYLINWDQGAEEFELRSDLKTMGDGKYVIGFSLGYALNYWEDALKKGIEGGYGTYVDSAGKSVLAAYNKLDIKGLDWFLISKIDSHEVETPVRNILNRSFYLSLALIILIGIGAFFVSRNISKPIIEDVKFAQAISEGQFDTSLKLEQKDELGKLAKTLNQMARNLSELDWLKKGKEGLDDAMRGDHDEDVLARDFIFFITKHLDAQLGAVYMHEEDVLKLKASYAFTNRKGNFNNIKIGEGMIGQAALEQELIIFNNAPEGSPAINYGVGERLASCYLIVPLIFEEALIGVFMVGSLTSFTPLQERFVRQIMDNAAVLMNMARSRQMIKNLYDQAQQHQKELLVKNEKLEEQTLALKESQSELQAQQEELRVTNEELEEQTRALKESEAELQAQQEELRVTNEELENHTQALEKQKKNLDKKNIDLVEAQEAIEKKADELELSSKYKSEFLANMSHELRTPLNSILILSQLFANNKDGNLSAKQVQSAGAIHSSGEDLLILINEILDLSKVEAGKIELVLEDIEIQSVVNDLTRIFGDLSSQKGVPFLIDHKTDLPGHIHTDSQRLQQVLRNLLTNAFKFTQQGAVTLSISRPSKELISGTSLKKESSISFAVKDDGIGIPKEQQAVIFEAFQQADGSTSRKYGGTGLGLSISRELSKLLGGMIYLASDEGKGSTFTIVIPERRQAVKEKLSSESPGARSIKSESLNQDIPVKSAPEIKNNMQSSSSQSVSFVKTPVSSAHDESFIKDDRKGLNPGDKSLLIIEDDPGSAEIMRDFARDRGYKSIVAEDGETGLHFADYYRPSAIILDIGLPGIDGWTVMERLKNNSELSHIPVHFMSAEDSSLDALRMGAVGYLSKPISLEKVDDTFHKLENMIVSPVRKLLVVEDDSTQRDSIKALIGNGDVETVMVGTGGEAFSELNRNHYDCMILDLGLEDMSGFELLEKIRKSDSCSTIPVIVYTGRDLTQDEDKLLRRYTESIIIKGVKSPERLLEESALFLHRVEANLPSDKQQMLKMVHNKEAALSDKTVLLVDDDMRNVFALSSILEEKNMNVVVGRDGLEGVQKLNERDDIDIVLMDIMMPNMDGYEAMQKIRKDRKNKNLPIIALTAKAMKGDRNKCLDAGANDYLAKPVDANKLISMLRVWLY